MKHLVPAKTILCVATLLCTGIWSAKAANIVTNPGFETGDFTGWTDVDPSGFSGVGNAAEFAHSGDHYAQLGALGVTGTLSQDLTTTPGEVYDLTFFLANGNTPGQLGPITSFDVLWNGVTVLSLPPNQGAFPYTEYSLWDLPATGSTTTLEFKYRQDNDWFDLDDVSVSVPESGSAIWLALPAFGLIGMLHFRARAEKSLARF